MRLLRLRFVVLVTTMWISVSLTAQTASPTTADGKRAWNIAQMYIEEKSPELAIDELKKVISEEYFAPAYLKLVELCYQIGGTKYTDMADSYSQEFISQWPARADEMKDLVSLGEAREKLKRKKFYESLIGDWHYGSFSINESIVCMKVRSDEDGRIDILVPKEMWDYDFVTSWQNAHFIQWEGDDGVILHENDSSIDGYHMKMKGEGYTFWYYVYLYIPFEQPEIADGKLKVKVKSEIHYGNNQYSRNDWSEATLVKD